jgi:hypothetical protein
MVSKKKNRDSLYSNEIDVVEKKIDQVKYSLI